MIAAMLLLQFVICLLLAMVLVRGRSAAPVDSRLGELPDQLKNIDARGEIFDAYARAALAQMRDEIAAEGRRSRETSSGDFTALRTEVTGSIGTLGAALHEGLNGFRADNTGAAERLRSVVREDMTGLRERLGGFMAEAARHQMEARDALNTRLVALGAGHAAEQEKLRAVVEERLDKLNTTNAAKLDEMRVIVDEKLQKTLHDRLNESFGQVTDQLSKVHSGLGEMKELATGVGDLKKVLSNVSRRGGVGEFMVGQQLEQMFSAEQYLKQVNIKRNTAEKVDFALKFPDGEAGRFVLLPIDAKFPTSDWERLEHAYDHGTATEIAEAGKAFERTVRAQAKSICEKYIDPPTTLPYGIMVLPTEGLYAEVLRRPGLQADIQSDCHVTVAGPATFMAILTSFQMGFHTLAIQRKGDEVWRVLASAKNEFDKFGGLMEKVRKQVNTVQSTLGEIGSKTTTINRTLKNVSSIESEVPVSNLIDFEDRTSVLPLLTAVGDES